MRVAGADVWRGRWAVVVLRDGSFDEAFVATAIEHALGRLGDAAVVGVDMPIGLPAPGTRRPCDELARRAVGRRWPSVFPAPPLAVLACGSHREANERASALGGPRISAQAYALRDRVLELQPVADRDGRVYEVHPEVSFARAAGGPLAWPKTSWNGLALRRRILEAKGIRLPDDLGDAGAAGPADLLDAAVVAWSASRIAAGLGVPLPAGSPRVGAIWS